jgi:hypothetical protein
LERQNNKGYKKWYLLISEADNDGCHFFSSLVEQSIAFVLAGLGLSPLTIALTALARFFSLLPVDFYSCQAIHNCHQRFELEIHSFVAYIINLCHHGKHDKQPQENSHCWFFYGSFIFDCKDVIYNIFYLHDNPGAITQFPLQ